MACIAWAGRLLIALLAATVAFAQDAPPQPASAQPPFANDYPTQMAGIFIQDSVWKPVPNEMPATTRVARGWAASLSYGAVPAKVVAEYNLEHAAVSIAAARPVICICRMISLPADPVIVQLHPKKRMRELDGGRMTVYPIVGGSKMADANKSDLIPVEQSHPDANIWLIRPQIPLAPGEYALMFGTQNINIYSFTVTAPPAEPAAVK